MYLFIGGDDLIKRVSFYTIGLLIATLGIALIILSAVGAGPWDAVFVGASYKLGLTVGTWSIIVQVLIVLFNAILLKKRPLFESGITIIVRGIFLDFWLIFVFPNVTFEASPMMMKWGVFVIGTFFLGAGIGTYIVSKLPPTPVDGMMKALSEKFNLSLKTSRTIVELAAVVIAFLLKGPVGIGTLILALTLGQFVQICHKYSQKLYDKF
jgi:uncharacterized protein